MLKDVCEFIIDCPHSTAKNQGNGYPLIRTPNIGKGRFNLDGVHRVSEDVYKKRNLRATPQDNDLIFAREAPAGNVAIIKNGQKFCLGQRTVLIRPNPKYVSPDFLNYFLLAPPQQYGLLGNANGATVAHVNLPTIRELKITLPPIETQSRIADILSAYDDLIENNQKQIKLLEEAAQRLYKEWFVDLHFPGCEQTKLIDGVPEGWKISTLDKVANLKAGGDKPKVYSDIVNSVCKIPIYSNGSENEGLYGYTDKARILEECITISARGNVGYTCLRRTPFVPIVRLISVIPIDIDVIYLYYYLKNLSFDSNGAAQQQITIPMIKEYKVIVPSEEILLEYRKVACSIHDKIDIIKNQNTLLKEARDRLLPKLMSGEIEV